MQPCIDANRSPHFRRKLSGGEFTKYNEIVLWFEYDLFDQTMLCYLLHSLAGQTLGDTKLSLLCIGDYPGVERFRGLGQLTVKQLKALSGTWRSVSERELALGSKMWEAYTSPLPEQHIRFFEEDTSALPFVKKRSRRIYPVSLRFITDLGRWSKLLWRPL
ncbi:hypothetical protein [Paenibacillus durus]|uniref:hypothetical protein n=1 Tax=Paenibacillus durus TaxID=44251 RepID=UPI000694619A|nr:hypothetical protein [Paenibacillus durus]